jgi:hypothetical protein
VRIEHGVEEGVDQGRFSQAGFAYERELELSDAASKNENDGTYRRPSW